MAESRISAPGHVTGIITYTRAVGSVQHGGRLYPRCALQLTSLEIKEACCPHGILASLRLL